MKTHKPKLEYLFWLYDPECDGVVYYDNKDERDADAKKALQGYLDEDGWHDEVEYVSMGEVTHFAQCKNKRMRPPDEELKDECDGEGIYWPGDVEWMGNYAMEEIK